jgi:hypothetical protein
LNTGYLEYLLNKIRAIDLINDPDRTELVQVTVTFDSGKVSHYGGHVAMLLVDSKW